MDYRPMDNGDPVTGLGFLGTCYVDRVRKPIRSSANV